MRKSFKKKAGIPSSAARWVVPSQLRVDMEMAAKVVGINTGELVTVALLRFLDHFVPEWNKKSAVQIPELPSTKLHRRPFTVRDLLEGMDG